MAFIIGLFTFAMFVDCAVLVFLVLIQLPKKDAGAGLAFGAGATDALFGAGSGNVLTRITKYAAGAFFVLALLLSTLQRVHHERNASEFQRKLGNVQMPVATPPPAVPAASTAPSATTPVPARSVEAPAVSVTSTNK